MRKDFTRSLVDLAGHDERVLLLTGDLGYSVLEPFAERFPERFINCGAAEQNMVGIATGLAEAGFIPFVYSIATFATLRPFEFIRDGPILHQLPVRIVGVGGGFDYGHNGVTHYALEDLAVMRTQPGIKSYVPCDGRQLSQLVLATERDSGPVYIRVGRGAEMVEGLNLRSDPSDLQVITPPNAPRRGHRSGSLDLVMVATGSITRNAVSAATTLSDLGISTCVGVVSTFNPSPYDAIENLLRRAPLTMTVEAHYLNGGLGSMVSELIAERGIRTLLERAAVDELPQGITGSQGFMEQACLIDPDGLVSRAQSLASRKLAK